MSYIAQRAERALLGAMLSDTPPAPDELRYLSASDLGVRRNRALFSAINVVRDAAPTLRGEALMDAILPYTQSIGLGRDQLHEFRAACPDPHHAPIYARMVQAARVRRDIAEHTERIAAIPAELRTDPLDRLSEAMSHNRRIHAGMTAAALDEPEAPLSFGLPREILDRRGQRAVKEDLLLADLLRNPDQAPDLARFLPPESFQSQQRQEVYTTIVTLAAHGDAVDAVIVLWQMELMRAAGRRTNPDPPGRPMPEDPYPEPDIAYLERLSATLTLAPAVELGQQILREDVQLPIYTSRTVAESAVRPISTRPTPLALDPSLQRPPTPHPGSGPRPSR